jgi:hypothetical membrane protein
MHKFTFAKHPITIWAGIIGPALFVGVFMLESLLRPGYNPLSMYVSALSLGPRGWLQIANFIVFGLLLLVFAARTAVELPNGKASRGGPILLSILGVCYLLSGPFVMDPFGTPQNQMTLHGTLHGIFGGIVFTLMPITCFVFLRRFRAEARWGRLRAWTLVLGSISAVGVIFLTISTKFPTMQLVFADWLGLVQRTGIIPFMLWLFLFALKLRALHRLELS